MITEDQANAMNEAQAQAETQGRTQHSLADGADQELGGLYDGFDAYRTVTEDDYRNLLSDGLVVADTNVFINLYRYSEQTRTGMLTVLEALGENLWVPRHVLVEFWRLRETVLQDPRDTDKTAKDLADRRDEVVSKFRAWASRVGLPQDRRDQLSSVLSEAFGRVIAGISELADDDASIFATDTAKDPVLAGLEPILRGRVGKGLAGTELKREIEEGLRRVSENVPPGFKDSSKKGDARAGDYLIWVETLQEAKRRQRDVLFVTGDVKDDWWRREHGELRGPLPELAEEMRKTAGVRLFMLRPESLAVHVRHILNIDVRDESVQEIERVSERENGGWTADAIGEFLARLSSEGWLAQEQAIRMAAMRGGFVEREIIYALGGYGEERSLKGFTRPINRIAREFRTQGILPESAIDILRTEYDPASGQPPGWASGFRVPDVLIPLILEWHHAKQAAQVQGPNPARLAEALQEFRALGHNVHDDATGDDTYGNLLWACQSCGSTFALTGPGGSWVSPSGQASCPRPAQDGGSAPSPAMGTQSPTVTPTPEGKDHPQSRPPTP